MKEEREQTGFNKKVNG